MRLQSSAVTWYLTYAALSMNSPRPMSAQPALTVHQLPKFLNEVGQLAGTPLDCGFQDMIDAFTSDVCPLSTASGNIVAQEVDKPTTLTQKCRRRTKHIMIKTYDFPTLCLHQTLETFVYLYTCTKYCRTLIFCASNFTNFASSL